MIVVPNAILHDLHTAKKPADGRVLYFYKQEQIRSYYFRERKQKACSAFFRTEDLSLQGTQSENPFKTYYIKGIPKVYCSSDQYCDLDQGKEKFRVMARNFTGFFPGRLRIKWSKSLINSPCSNIARDFAPQTPLLPPLKPPLAHQKRLCPTKNSNSKRGIRITSVHSCSESGEIRPPCPKRRVAMSQKIRSSITSAHRDRRWSQANRAADGDGQQRVGNGHHRREQCHREGRGESTAVAGGREGTLGMNPGEAAETVVGSFPTEIGGKSEASRRRITRGTHYLSPRFFLIFFLREFNPSPVNLINNSLYSQLLIHSTHH